MKVRFKILILSSEPVLRFIRTVPSFYKTRSSTRVTCRGGRRRSLEFGVKFPFLDKFRNTIKRILHFQAFFCINFTT